MNSKCFQKHVHQPSSIREEPGKKNNFSTCCSMWWAKSRKQNVDADLVYLLIAVRQPAVRDGFILNEAYIGTSLNTQTVSRDSRQCSDRLLTPWSRVLLEKLTGSAASQEIPRSFGTRRILTVLTSARHLSLSWANSIQSPQAPLTLWRSILTLSSHLRLGLPNGLYPSGLPTRNLCTPLPSPQRSLLLQYMASWDARALVPRTAVNIGFLLIIFKESDENDLQCDLFQCLPEDRNIYTRSLAIGEFSKSCCHNAT